MQRTTTIATTASWWLRWRWRGQYIIGQEAHQCTGQAPFECSLISPGKLPSGQLFDCCCIEFCLRALIGTESVPPSIFLASIAFKLRPPSVYKMASLRCHRWYQSLTFAATSETLIYPTPTFSALFTCFLICCFVEIGITIGLATWLSNFILIMVHFGPLKTSEWQPKWMFVFIMILALKTQCKLDVIHLCTYQCDDWDMTPAFQIDADTLWETLSILCGSYSLP